MVYVYVASNDRYPAMPSNWMCLDFHLYNQIENIFEFLLLEN
jgi:hypothetical protein